MGASNIHIVLQRYWQRLQRYGLFLRDFLTNPRPHFSTLTLSALVDTAPVVGAGNTRLFYIVEELTFHDNLDFSMVGFEPT